MKKLRPSENEKAKFLEDLTERLSWFNRGSLEEFDIDDLIKEYSKLPNNIKKPTIYVTAIAYIKMLELVNQSAVECSWHGLVKRFGDQYLIHDVIVFPQINSPTSTTTDEKEFAEWQTGLIMNPDFPIEELRLHGHSHVNMNVFSSGVDDKYQKDLLTKVDNGDYYIFLIMNKKMEMCIFLYDFEQQVMFETKDIDFKITACKDDLRQWAKDQLKKNAITERPQYQPYKNYRFMYDEEEEPYSYFSKSKPIFKGANNGSK